MSLSRTSPAWMLWAKTRGVSDPSLDYLRQSLWLSVPQHLRDSADVGIELSRTWIPASIHKRLALKNELTAEQVHALIGFLTGTHDSGKVETSFQTQLKHRPDVSWLADQALSALPADARSPSVNPAFNPPHSRVSDAILRRELARHFPSANYRTICTISSIAGAHHGRPSELPMHQEPLGAERLMELNTHLDRHGPVWAHMWSELVDDILERTHAAEALGVVLRRGGLDIADQILLAGVVSMADWIASNQELFELTETGRHESDNSRAAGALERLALTNPWVPTNVETPPFRRRFGWPEGSQLRSCQKVAIESVQHQQDPALVIICEEMGRGKTEAALLTAEVVAGNQGAGGVAFALPSQVTTNAMLPRISHWVESLEQKESHAQHSLRLMHSNAHLSHNFEDLMRHTRSINDGSEHGGVIAHQWFSGRKGLLSEFTVSTVDQVLMMALQSKYVALRHLGLSGKVVIIDEVHSYDHYTRSYLERTLTWLAAQGVSVILLSATLASSVQAQLENAYSQGLELKKAKSSKRSKHKCTAAQPSDTFTFPSVSVTTAKGTKRANVEAEQECRNIVLTSIDDSLDSLVAVLHNHLTDGGVVGVVCNTVARAQQAFIALHQFYGDDVVLLHSQLTVAERSRLESQLVNDLGKHGRRDPDDSHVQRPHLRIVVGTQVLEQSLDVDFDLLVSDFSPVDLLAQRAGRLHRHKRPETDRPKELRSAQMIIRGLDTARITDDAAPTFEPGAEAIYGTYLLLATANALKEYIDRSPWCIRHNLYPKVEEVYSQTQDVPLMWHEKFVKAHDEYELLAEESQMRASVFQMCTPLQAESNLSKALGVSSRLDADNNDLKASASVRDIQPTLEAILLWEEDGYRYPLPWLLSPGEEQAPLSETQPPPREISRLLAESVIKIPRWIVPEYKIDDAITELEGYGIAAWQSDFRLKGQLVLHINRDFTGSVLGNSFMYIPAIGFVRPDHAHDFDFILKEVSPSFEGDFDDTYFDDPDDFGGELA